MHQKPHFQAIPLQKQQIVTPRSPTEYLIDIVYQTEQSHSRYWTVQTQLNRQMEMQIRAMLRAIMWLGVAFVAQSITVLLLLIFR